MRGFEVLRQVGGRLPRRPSRSIDPRPQYSASVCSSGFEQEDRRSHFRVETRLPVRLSWLTNDQAQALMHAIEVSGGEERSGSDEGLRLMLQRIEEKLDLPLQGQAGAAPPPLCRIEPGRVVLSGSGLGTGTGEPLRSGDPVKVELLLPGAKTRAVTALARVVYGPSRRVRGAPEKVALAFENIDTGDRDAIVRHVYDIQRIMLRGRAHSQARP